MTGWAEIDQVLPSRGLDTARLHEWVGVMPATSAINNAEKASGGNAGAGAKRGASRPWTPALSMLAHLARRVVERAPHRQVLWIGERVWPCPLSMDEAVLRRSVFVRATKWFERVWAADLALRSGAAAAVIVDAGGMDLSATRRLQLAAESGGKGGVDGGMGEAVGAGGRVGGWGALCLIARPPWESSQLTAATTRWGVSLVSLSGSVGFECPARLWSVELLRCKGVQPEMAAPRRWILEHDHASHGLVVARVLDGSGESAAESSWRRASG